MKSSASRNSSGLVLCLLLGSSCHLHFHDLYPSGGSAGGPTFDDIKGTDDSTFMPLVRAEMDLTELANPKLREGDSAFVQASLSTVDGGFSQFSGNSVVGGQSINGNLDVDFTMTEFTVSEHVGILLGYHFWAYNHDHGMTELDLQAAGLLMGMTVNF